MTHVEAEKLIDVLEHETRADARCGRSVSDPSGPKFVARERLLAALAQPPWTDATCPECGELLTLDLIGQTYCPGCHWTAGRAPAKEER
jgi:uncharacterized Zn finger protein (UPF0148 family)